MAYRFKLSKHDTSVLRELCYLQKNALMIPDDAKYEEKFFEFICDNYLEKINEFSLQIYVSFIDYFKTKQNFNKIEKIFDEFKPNEVLTLWLESLKSFKKVSQRIFDAIKNKIIKGEGVKIEKKPNLKEEIVKIKRIKDNKVYIKKFDEGIFSIDDIADRLNAAVNFDDEN